jgi:ferric-dicitrate binding protein FerR (iron transport regulator)
MKDYINYNAVDFVQDDQFLRWVKYPGLYPELNQFWKDFIEEHHYKSNDIEEARRLITAIIEEGESEEIVHKQDEVLARLQRSIKNTSSGAVKERSASRAYFYAIAASVVGIITVGTLWFVSYLPDQQKNITKAEQSDFIKEVNNGTTPKTILLSDGSSIILKPGSDLQYPRVFQPAFREVILNGEGFFEISKDAQRPFLVYTDKVVTKVLGTSFTIRAFEKEKDILVQVKTGKVSVFTRDEENNESEALKDDVLLLVPNQQAVYNREEEKLVKSLVDEPAILNATKAQQFNFQDVPLKEVFTTLEQAYGVDIIYDEELMSECFLNVSLDDMPLYDKMRVICKTMEARYEVVDSHIVVTGKGCKDE